MIDPVDTVTQALPVTSDSPILRRFASEDRLYAAMLTRDLFGEWVLVQAWGGRYNQRGGKMTRVMKSFEAGVSALTGVAKRREQRGYQPIE